MSDFEHVKELLEANKSDSFEYRTYENEGWFTVILVIGGIEFSYFGDLKYWSKDGIVISELEDILFKLFFARTATPKGYIIEGDKGNVFDTLQEAQDEAESQHIADCEDMDLANGEEVEKTYTISEVWLDDFFTVNKEIEYTAHYEHYHGDMAEHAPVVL